MLTFEQANTAMLKVYDDSVFVGYISDSCCLSNVQISQKPRQSYNIRLEYQRGKGGFVAKGIYLEKLKEIFTIAYNSDAIKAALLKNTIRMTKNDIDNGIYKDILNKYENG